MGVLAVWMQNAPIYADHLASEMRTVIQELRMNKDSYWRLMLQKASAMMFPANHPYHYPIIGYKEDLAVVNVDKLSNFYKKYYHPHKATIFVVGDIDPDVAIQKIKQEFEAISSHTKASLVRHSSLSDGVSDRPAGEKKTEEQFPVVYEMETHQAQMYQNVQREQLGLFWRIPGRQKLKKTLVEATSYILGEGEGSRLYRRLVDEEKIATSVYVGAYQLLHEGIFMILVEPHEGKTDLCKAVIQEELKKILKEGIEKEELQKVVTNKQRSFLELMERHSSLVYEWIESYFATRDENALFNRVREYELLTIEDIKAFVIKSIDPFFMNEIVVKPLPENKKAQWAALRKHEEHIERRLVDKTQRATPLEQPRFVHTLQQPEILDFSIPKPEHEFTLANGLKVFLKRETQWPLITISCSFRDADFYGSARKGISLGIMMDMLIEGSEGFTKENHVTFFEQMGVSYAFGQSGVQLSMLNKEYIPVLERFVHILTKPAFGQEPLEKLKAIIKDAFVRAKDDPKSVAQKTIVNSVYQNHPYQWTFDDGIDTANDLDTSLLSALHKEVVSPSQMVLSVVGDFDSATMQQAITKIFESWSGASYKKQSIHKRDFSTQNVDTLMLRDQVVLSFGRPSELTITHSDYIPLQLLNTVAFYSLGSRIYKLREQTGLFYNAQGKWAMNATKQQGMDYIMTMVNPDNVEKAEKGIREMLITLGNDGVTQHELDAARQLFIKGVIDRVSSLQSKAQLFAQLEALELGLDFYDKALARVQTMKLDELNTLAKKYFNDENFARVRVGRVGSE